MLKRYFGTSVPGLRIQLSQKSPGDLNRFRAAFAKNEKPSEPRKERASASPNRFRSLHERNSQQNNVKRGNNSNGRDTKTGPAFRGGNRFPNRRFEMHRPMFEINTGSERAQTALKSLIMKVKDKSSNYDVHYVDPHSKEFLTVSLESLVNKLDLRKEGIRVLPPQADGLPIIRVIPVSEMLESYVDELAAIKQQELLDMGSARALKAASMRAQAERKKSATKILTVSWSISVSDLQNQKRNEIEKRLNKDGKLVVFIGEKSSLSSARSIAEKEDALAKQLKTSNTNWERMDEDEHALEMKRREMIFGKLDEVLQELDCKWEISGSLDARMMIKISSNNKTNTNNEKKDAELSPKELKRLRKLEKAREKSQQKASKLAEDDIDSLYSLKIED
ncbi:hypothetical protein OXX79_011531 [Metschnikowia pulcherrima]